MPIHNVLYPQAQDNTPRDNPLPSKHRLISDHNDQLLRTASHNTVLVLGEALCMGRTVVSHLLS